MLTKPGIKTDPALLDIANGAFGLCLSVAGGQVRVTLTDRILESIWCDGPYHYSLQVDTPEGLLDCRQLRDAVVSRERGGLTVSARLGSLALRHCWELSDGQPWLDETITLTNDGAAPVCILTAEFGCLRRMADSIGSILPEVEGERLVALPFRKRPTDPAGYVNDHPLSDLIALAGREPRCDDRQRYGFLPSRHWCSEAWAWTRGRHTLALMKFNQERIEWSTVSTVTEPGGLSLRFGGAYLTDQDGWPALRLAPGESVSLGLMRYQAVAGGYTEVAYAYRAMLDARGCRFPDDFNPPVHWNELYDNPEWWVAALGELPAGSRIATRNALYTRAAMEQEAEKACAYHCESLYLDPGWDTTFGSFIWDEARLGKAGDFVKAMRDRHGLAVSLHAPLATWMSSHGNPKYMRSTECWPAEARRMSAPGVSCGEADRAQLCLGSRPYLDEAERRLLALCEAGVVYLMFDGNWWNGGCWHSGHGHPVPYTRADHIRANLDLARRLHARYPRVLIEMHDMLAGGAHARATPVYYQYGLPGSYDSNWGFELMWNPIEDLRQGRAQALYYYNLGCNVPMYLHIDLRDDNEHCTFLWWFASTCRHLGIGGTHANPNIAAAQRQAMSQYRRLDAFYKRGDFYGISEEIHVHVLPERSALVVNIFNLSDQPRRVAGAMPCARLGLATDRFYRRSERWAGFDTAKDLLTVGCMLPPWGHQLVELGPVE